MSGAAAGARPMDVLVRGAARRASLAYTGQAVCVGLAALGLGLAAAVASGAGILQPGTHVAALVAALSAGAAWRLGQRVDAPGMARRADAALGLEGALVAAYEEEARLPGGAFAALGARRVLQRARPGVLREAALPPTLPFAAAPFVAAVCLGLVISAVERAGAVPPDPGARLVVRAGDLVAAASSAAARAGTVDEDGVAALGAVSSEARALGATAPDAAADPAEAAAWERAVEELARALDARRAALGPEARALREGLAEAAAALDAATLGRRLAASDGADADPEGDIAAGDGPGPVAAPPAGAVDPAAGTAAAAAAAPGGTQPGGTVTGEGGAGTIPGSTGPDGRPPAAPGEVPGVPAPGAPTPAPAGQDAPVVAEPGPRWPRHLDPLVERWQRRPGAGR